MSDPGWTKREEKALSSGVQEMHELAMGLGWLISKCCSQPTLRYSCPGVVPSSESVLACDSLLIHRIQQKGHYVISEGRSKETLQLPPVSL